MKFSPQLPFDFSISEKYTFDNFLASSSNAELVTLLKDFGAYREAVAFIWGIEGVGKSHLLQAVCVDQESRGVIQPLYLPMKKIHMYGTEVFNSLHHMDLVCIDDLQCIVGQPEWEEALFEFFNRSRDAGVRLLVAADAPPRGLEFALPDLASRMSWGVTYQLHELNDEEKMAALAQRAIEKQLTMSADVLNYIFNRHSRELHSLLDVMDTLDQLSLAEKRRLTVPFVRQVMGWQ